MIAALLWGIVVNVSFGLKSQYITITNGPFQGNYTVRIIFYINFARFGIQGSGVKYNAHALWKNWTNVNNWVCSYYPINSVLIYDCIPEVILPLIIFFDVLKFFPSI